MYYEEDYYGQNDYQSEDDYWQEEYLREQLQDEEWAIEHGYWETPD